MPVEQAMPALAMNEVAAEAATGEAAAAASSAEEAAAARVSVVLEQSVSPFMAASVDAVKALDTRLDALSKSQRKAASAASAAQTASASAVSALSARVEEIHATQAQCLRGIEAILSALSKSAPPASTLAPLSSSSALTSSALDSVSACSSVGGEAVAGPAGSDADEAADELFECAICMEPIERAATGSCSHHYCFGCLLGHCASAASQRDQLGQYPVAECPKCRAPILQIRRDQEFDSAMAAAAPTPADAGRGSTNNAEADAEAGADGGGGGEQSAAAMTIAQHTLTVHVPRKARVGLTLANPLSGPGVIVSAIKKPKSADDDAACAAYKAGMRVGDVLVAINDVPCYDHAQAIRLLDHLTRGKSAAVTLACVLLAPSVGRSAPSASGWTPFARRGRGRGRSSNASDETRAADA